MSICEMVNTQKWYYIQIKRSACFPINGTLHGEREKPSMREREGVRERKRERQSERKAMSMHEKVKTQQKYYLHNMRSAYFPINRELHG